MTIGWHLLTVWIRELFFFFNETLQATFKFAVCLRLFFLVFVFFSMFMKRNSNIYRDSFEQVLSKGKQIKSPLKSNLPSTHVPEATELWIRRLGLFFPFLFLFFFKLGFLFVYLGFGQLRVNFGRERVPDADAAQRLCSTQVLLHLHSARR